MYSVLILTLNEEINLAGCIASLKAGTDVVVLDSLSTDSTIEIATRCGAKFVQREFDNYAAQRNAGLALEIFDHPWILMLDADERMTDELHAEIVARLKGVDDKTVMFRMRRKDLFMGRWIRRSSGYPTWFGRLVKRGHVTVEREINEEFVAYGGTAYLEGHLEHHPFNKGVAYWIERHNRYSSMEASSLAKERSVPIRWSGLFDVDPTVRRKWAKQVVYRMRGRPVLIFCYLYVVRGGILDGTAGFFFCLLRSMYEWMIDLKVIEARRASRGLTM